MWRSSDVIYSLFLFNYSYSNVFIHAYWLSYIHVLLNNFTALMNNKINRIWALTNQSCWLTRDTSYQIKKHSMSLQEIYFFITQTFLLHPLICQSFLSKLIFQVLPATRHFALQISPCKDNSWLGRFYCGKDWSNALVFLPKPTGNKSLCLNYADVVALPRWKASHSYTHFSKLPTVVEPVKKVTYLHLGINCNILFKTSKRYLNNQRNVYWINRSIWKSFSKGMHSTAIVYQKDVMKFYHYNNFADGVNRWLWKCL